MSVVVSDRDREFDESTPHVRADAGVWRYGDESVAWSPDRVQPTYLDAVGSLVFQFLDGTVRVAELVADVQDAIGVPGAIARTQIRRVVDQLDGAGLLTSSRRAESLDVDLELFTAPPNP